MTSALRWGWVISNTPQPLYPPERPCTHFTGGWVDPRAGLEGCGKSCPPPGFDPRTVQPVASRYTDWAIAAHYLLIGEHVFFCSRLQQCLLTRNMTYDRLILRILTQKFVEIGINSALITWYHADSFFNIYRPQIVTRSTAWKISAVYLGLLIIIEFYITHLICRPVCYFH